jgi:hypothetical protein
VGPEWTAGRRPNLVHPRQAAPLVPGPRDRRHANRQSAYDLAGRTPMLANAMTVTLARNLPLLLAVEIPRRTGERLEVAGGHEEPRTPHPGLTIRMAPQPPRHSAPAAVLHPSSGGEVHRRDHVPGGAVEGLFDHRGSGAEARGPGIVVQPGPQIEEAVARSGLHGEQVGQRDAALDQSRKSATPSTRSGTSAVCPR